MYNVQYPGSAGLLIITSAAESLMNYRISLSNMEDSKTIMNETDFSSLSRPIHLMPEFVKEALLEQGLLDAYHNRPPYQQNDYIGWINRAKRAETRQKRLDQMLYELERGVIYMKMTHTPKPPKNEPGS